ATVAAARGRAYGVVLRCPDAAANASGGGGSRGDAAGARPSRRGGLPGGRRGQAARLPRGRLVVGPRRARRHVRAHHRARARPWASGGGLVGLYPARARGERLGARSGCRGGELALSTL